MRQVAESYNCTGTLLAQISRWGLHIDVCQYMTKCFSLIWFSKYRSSENDLGEPEMKLLPIAATIATLLIAGCETPSPKTTDSIGNQGTTSLVPTVPANRSMVVFFRGNEFAGSANIYRVFVNGNAVADMSVGTRHVQEVSPGTVNLNAETVASVLNVGLGLVIMEKPQLQLQAKAGQLYVIEIDPGFAGGPVFKQRDSQALSSTQGYSPAKAPSQ